MVKATGDGLAPSEHGSTPGGIHKSYRWRQEVHPAKIVPMSQ